MQTTRKSRIDITVEAPLLKRVLGILDGAGVTGYTVIPAIAGRGASGAWSADGLVGRAGALVTVFTIVDPSRVDTVLEPLFKVVEKQIGIVTVSDVQVIRPQLF